MLHLLENNFILAALVSLVIVLIIYFDSRKKDTRNISSYLRYFALCFLLVLGTLFFRTRNFSLPTITLPHIGGSNPGSSQTQCQPTNLIGGGDRANQSDLLNIGDPDF